MMTPSIRGRTVWIITWYTDTDTTVLTEMFQYKDDACKFYDDLTKRGVVFAGIKEQAIR